MPSLKITFHRFIRNKLPIYKDVVKANGLDFSTIFNSFKSKRRPEIAAFPGALADVVGLVSSKLAKSEDRPPHGKFQVLIRGKKLEIPYRVYYGEAALLDMIEKSGTLEALVAACLGAKHCDGFTREKCIKILLTQNIYWTVPFVVQLIGEYVVEIVLTIEQALRNADAKIYREFLWENKGYVETIERRVTSYWNAYYRLQYPALEEYPGFKAVAALKKM